MQSLTSMNRLLSNQKPFSTATITKGDRRDPMKGSVVAGVRLTIATSLAIMVLASGGTARAQGTFESLAQFPADGSSGSFPISALTLGPDGTFYGVTYQGGSDNWGTVYTVTPAGQITPINNFHMSDGAAPDATLVLGSDGNFYGTTLYWGSSTTNGPGTVFTVTPGGLRTPLLYFSQSDVGGSFSTVHGDRLTIGPDGSIYGTIATNNIFCTPSPTCNPLSFVYKLSGGSMTVLHTFDPNDVFELSSLTLASDGYLYGTTLEGGGDQYGNAGTIYRIGTDGSGFQVLHAFDSVTEGYSPGPLMQASDGALYGMTEFSVFKIDLAGNFSLVSNRAGYGYAEPFPPGRLIDRGDGFLYGVIMSGAYRFNEQVCNYCLAGAVIRIDPQTGDILVLHQFDGADGLYPTGLAAGPDGALYGATAEGGSCDGATAPCGSYTDGVRYVLYCTSQCGTIFRISGLPAVNSADTTPPVVTVPAATTIEATSPAGATVTFSATAADPDDAAGPVGCSPASGSTFPLGATTVTCTSTDTHGNTGTASFTVTVVDTTPPTITMPSAILVDATSPSGAVVTYAASATDAVSGDLPVACSPASGSTFPVGPTVVTCSATDASGNSALGEFVVSVQGASQIASELIVSVIQDGFQQARNLLWNVLRQIESGNTRSVCGQLDAFELQVRAQAGKSLTSVEAASLLAQADAAQFAAGCR